MADARPSSRNVEIQLTLDAFDRTRPPLCDSRPALNGFKRLCYHCSHAERSESGIVCTLFDRRIGAWDKYGLTGWKQLRAAVLSRDGGRCVVCGAQEDLHIHHIDHNPTNDDPANLVTLCEGCHARAHTEMRREGGRERVARMFAHAAAHDEERQEQCRP